MRPELRLVSTNDNAPVPEVETFAFAIWDGGIVARHNAVEISAGEALLLLADRAAAEARRLNAQAARALMRDSDTPTKGAG